MSDATLDTDGLNLNPLPGPQTEEMVAEVGAQMNRQLGDIALSISDTIANRVGELRGEEQSLAQLLGSSVEGNVETILHVLRHSIAWENVEAPSAALEYARRLAQREVPVNALVRAYRLGQDHLLKLSFAEIQRAIDDPTAAFCTSQRFVTTTFRYIDWMSQQVVATYEQEREQWLEQVDVLRTGRIEEVLDGEDVNLSAAEAAIGYRLRRHHLGLVVWTARSRRYAHPDLERFVTTLARGLQCRGRPLTAARDSSSIWAWLPLGAGADVDAAALRRLCARYPQPPSLACGELGYGLEGFRETHRQAVKAQTVTLTRGGDSSVTAYGEPGLSAASLLTADTTSTRTWVRQVLGPLALDDEYHQRLRETIETLLSVGGGYTAAAERLSMHKNSVKYRVGKAEDELGRPVSSDRLNIELALTACRWLGPVVLQRSG